MARSLLLVVLFLSVLLELAIAGGVFFAPAYTMARFGVVYGPALAFVAYVLGWLLLFVSLVAVMALVQVWNRRPGFASWCYLLAIWWIGIGLGIYIFFGRLDNLWLDTVKGLLILLLTWRCQVTRVMTRRY